MQSSPRVTCMTDPLRPGSDPLPSEAGAVDLLGILAYGALVAFDRLVDDARRAPSWAERVHVVRLAAHQVAHFEAVETRLAALGVDVLAAAAPFQRAFDAFYTHTAPKDWLEGLVWTYVGNGFATDFYREIAAFVDPETRAVVLAVLAEGVHNDFIVETVRAGITADPKVAGRLALWGRRLVGEALSQAQRVAADRDALTALLTGATEDAGMDLAAMSRLFSTLIEKHTVRMRTLGLQA